MPILSGKKAGLVMSEENCFLAVNPQYSQSLIP